MVGSKSGKWAPAVAAVHADVLPERKWRIRPWVSRFSVGDGVGWMQMGPSRVRIRVAFSGG